MARRVKRKPKKKLILMIVILAIVLIGIGTYFMFFNKNEVKENKVVSTIPKYGYTLKSNKSAAYKKLFQEFEEIT